MEKTIPTIKWISSELCNVGATYRLNALTIVLGLCCLYLLYILIYGLFLCPTRHIPGPFLSRFGAVYYNFIFSGGSVSIKVYEFHKKYGPVVRLAPKKINVNLPEVAFKAWGVQNKTKLPWDRDPEFCAMARLGMSVENILSMAHAQDALRQRRLIGTPFAKKFLLDQEHIFKKCTKTAMENLDRLRESNDGKVDVVPQFMKYAFDVISEFAYGGYFKGDKIRQGIDEIQLISQVPLSQAIATYFPITFNIIKHIPLKALAWTRSREEFIEICDLSIREYKKNVKPGTRKDSLSTIIASKDEDGSGLTHDDLVSLAIIIIFAGVDTTSVALTYISYQLAKHPDYFEKLANELSCYKDIDDLQLIELEKLPILNAVIREVLRLYPPFPSPMGRVTPPEGTTLGNYHIPGGTIVCHEAWAVCRDPNIFRDPDSFRPERWLGLSRNDETRMWNENMVFGYGPRICLGKEMALMEIRMLLSAMVIKYTWTGVPDKPDNWDEEMKPHDTAIIHPMKGKCVLTLEPRA